MGQTFTALLFVLSGLLLALLWPRSIPDHLLLCRVIAADLTLRKALDLPWKGTHMDTLQAAVDSLVASVSAAVAKVNDLKAKQEDPAKIQALVDKLKAADEAIKSVLA